MASGWIVLRSGYVAHVASPSAGLLVLLGLQPQSVQAGTTAPSFSAVTVPASVAQYAKHEISFSLTTVASNLFYPYDAAPPTGVTAQQGVTVYATYTVGASSWQVPAFWSRDFSVATKDGRRWQLPLTTGKWYVRFTPVAAGSYTVRLTAQDAGGTTQTTSYGVTVTTASALGFIRVASDTRYFARTTGELVFPLGIQGATPTPASASSIATTYAGYAAYGYSLVRIWMSGIFGGAWGEWVGWTQAETWPIDGGYLPRSGLLPYQNAVGDQQLTWRINYPATNPSSYWFNSQVFQGQYNTQAVKQATNYRIQVTYRGVNISGPRDLVNSYGVVVKLGSPTLPENYNAAHTVATAYGGTNATWGTISGTWASGTNNWLPAIHVVLCNVNNGAEAYIQSVAVQEDLGGGSYGPNLLDKTSFAYHTFVPERLALDIDDTVAAAQTNNVPLKIVLLDKEDALFKKMDTDGTWVIGGEGDNADGFYDAGRTLNWTRWHMQAWWRYCVARWGYSPAIHSWEFTNEGDFSTAHSQATDEFAKYMKYTVYGIAAGGATHPNRHLCTTSFAYAGIDSPLWNTPATYPYPDYADLHAYVSTSDGTPTEEEAMEIDAAYFHLFHSAATRARGLSIPWMRGEAGINASGQDTDTGATQALGPNGRFISQDTNQWWLHNFLWSCLDSGAMGELYWYTEHITAAGGPKFGIVKSFLQALPLASGGYVDVAATLGNGIDAATVRVVGQKNTTLRRAHLWVQNRQHTWYNVVEGVTPTPRTGTIEISGFTASASYTLTTINTLTGATASTASVTANASGVLSLPVTSLSTDLAFTIDGETLTGDDPYPAVPTSGFVRYVSPTGSNSNNGLTTSTPWQTLAYALPRMSRPGTLVLMDGTYTEQLNPEQAPSGSEWLTIMAHHEDLAVIDGQSVRNPVSMSSDWLGAINVTLLGLKAIDGVDACYYVKRKSLTIRRCTGFNSVEYTPVPPAANAYAGPADTNSAVFMIYPGLGSAANILIEQCVAHGYARKMFLIFGASSGVTVRQCFGMGWGWNGRRWCMVGWPYTSTFEFYGTPGCIFENNIAYGQAEAWHYFVKTDENQSGFSYYGNLALYAGQDHTGGILPHPIPSGGFGSDPEGTRARPTGGDGCTIATNWSDDTACRTGFCFYPGDGVQISNILYQDNLCYGNRGQGIGWPGCCGTIPGSSMVRNTLFGNGLDNPPKIGDAAVHCDISNITSGDGKLGTLNWFATVSDNKIERVYNGSSTTSHTGTGARLRYRYVNGVQGTTPLWPFPINNKIRTQTALAGREINITAEVTTINATPVWGGFLSQP